MSKLDQFLIAILLRATESDQSWGNSLADFLKLLSLGTDFVYDSMCELHLWNAPHLVVYECV